MEDIKKLLEQYVDLQEERKDKQAAVDRVQRKLDVLEVKGYKEQDSVTGGLGGTQHFKVEGYPYPEYHRQKTLLLIRREKLQKVQEKIESQLVAVEELINNIDDSATRRMLTYRYIDGMSWLQVAKRMGGGNTEDGCRKAIERYLKSVK